MRIITVRLDYQYDRPAEEGAQPVAEKRRDRLSNLGFDVTHMDDEGIRSYPILGMTDAQFVELTLAGEENMKIMASCVVDDFPA